MKKTLKIIGIVLLTILGLLIAWVLFVSLVLQDNSYYYGGGYAPDGTYCDVGYKQATGTCCDDDDYSCEVCDIYGIYCDLDSMFQGSFSDIEHIPNIVGEGDYDCSYFISWDTAQKVYIRDGGPKKDPYNLDEDDDGLACETLLEELNEEFVNNLRDKRNQLSQ